MIRTFAEIVERVAELPTRRIAVARAEEPEVLRAVDRARELGLATAVLVGDAPEIRGRLGELGLDPHAYEIVDADGLEGAAATAVRLVADGHADTLMKGLVDTNVLLKAVLDREHGLRSAPLLSHVAVFELDRYPKLLAMTDGGMLMYPDAEQKAHAIANALAVTRALGIGTAKVALLAAKEKVNPKMPATVDAAELAGRDFPGAIVAGPMALDGAVSPACAAVKGMDSPVAGDADVLVVPQIEAGNVLYKSLTLLAGARAAGIVLGARAPIVLTSRADDETAKLHSIALAMLVAAGERGA